MSNVSDLDKRAIYITFHIRTDTAFTQISYELHRYLKQLTSKPTKAVPLKYTPGLISALDFADSKEGLYTTRDPHIHAVAVLGQPISERDCLVMIQAISDFLNSNHFVKTHSVHIKQFEIFKKKKTNKADETSTYQMLNLIDYNRKKRLGDDREVIVLPYQDIMYEPDNDNSIKLKDHCYARSNQILTEIQDPQKQHRYFSKRAR
jgi:hypothetical protein